MDKARETIARVLGDKFPDGVAILSADDVAQLFDAALPAIIADMVEPLEWTDTTSGTSRFPAWKSGAYFIVNSLNTGRFIMDKRKFNCLSDAIDAANAHRRATTLAALGMKEQGE
ncbi:MAG: hypothetical protein Unbinned7865contig1001_3 [Prokaryotic dsDNA virus sp.]|nr:MAG: hypothetical protein Unbinned7865contig1001_3 [Prokaryotic dsDNA virus sp.]|tara:strand:- start:20983 stop:21327 length:345 start_codon:yes stop_codon:yes gene_type:complete